MDPRSPDDEAVPSDADLRRALTRGLDGPAPTEGATLAVHRRAWARRTRRRRAVLGALAVGAVALLAPAVAWSQRGSGPDGGVHTSPAGTVPATTRPAGPPSTVVPPTTALALPAPTIPPGVTTTTVVLSPATSWSAWDTPTPVTPPTTGVALPPGAWDVQWWPGWIEHPVDPSSTALPVHVGYLGAGPDQGACITGPPGDRLAPPVVIEEDDYVLIRFHAASAPVAEGGEALACPMVMHTSPTEVSLAAPLGDRALYDGATSPPERRR